jgi:hypothetical protein
LMDHIGERSVVVPIAWAAEFIGKLLIWLG